MLGQRKESANSQAQFVYMWLAYCLLSASFYYTLTPCWSIRTSNRDICIPAYLNWQQGALINWCLDKEKNQQILRRSLFTCGQRCSLNVPDVADILFTEGPHFIKHLPFVCKSGLLILCMCKVNEPQDTLINWCLDNGNNQLIFMYRSCTCD